MAKKLTNNSAGRVVLSDNRQDGVYRSDISLDKGDSITVSDEKYASLKGDLSNISVAQDQDELNELAREALSADMGLPVSAADAASAPASYDQSHIQSLVDLANELKAKLDAIES